MKDRELLIVSRPNVPKDTACVYMIKLGSRFYYIGATKCLNERVNGHILNLKRGKINDQKIPILNGRDTFLIEILELVNDINLLQEREQYYIEKYRGRRGRLNSPKNPLYRCRKSTI